MYRDPGDAFDQVSLKWTEYQLEPAREILTVGQDALFHWETLFVISASNTENVSFPFVA